MAASIRPPVNSESVRKPVLVNTIKGFTDTVNMAVIIPREDGVISVSDDKTVRVWLKRDTGQYWPSICHNMLEAALCLVYNGETRRLFVGLDNGTISEFILSEDFNKMVCERDYLGSVRSLAWDPNKSLLFSGSFDQSVIVWDIGGKKGTVFELQGHQQKVQALVYSMVSMQLLSTADDRLLGIWDMAVKRIETPKWVENDHCQTCEKPFFWNLRKMWAQKTMGIRQHHCRKCGKAMCENCSSQMSTIPPMGYEYDVRVCDTCYEKITDKERTPLAVFHDLKHIVIYMFLEETRKQLLTVGKDKVIKLWDLSSVLQ